MSEPSEILPPGVRGRRDIVLFAGLMLLALAGLLTLIPASAPVSLRDMGDAAYSMKRQLAWFSLGMLAFFVCAVLPLETLRKLAVPALVLAGILLVLVFVPGIGRSVQSRGSGSFHRWISVAGVGFQPSEFAKPALILYVSALLAPFANQTDTELDLTPLTARLLPVGAILLAIVLEPQFGTTVCILTVLVALVYLCGFPLRRLLLAGLALLPVLLALVYLAPYRWSRMRVWLDPFAHKEHGGYQLVTSFRAFAEGGLWGQDLARGFAHRYLTYGHTDFVLALLAENFGLLGVVCLLVLLLAIVWRAIRLLVRVSDGFARTLGAGSLIMLLFQAILNMFVVTGIAPTTGVSLPFLSYGGSSLIASLMLAGLLVNVTRFAGATRV